MKCGDRQFAAATKPQWDSCQSDHGMDSTMNSLSTRALVGAGAAALALVGALSVAALPLVAGLVSAAIVVGAAVFVAFAAQSQRLRDEERLVYRPVYVRRQNVQRRVRSDHE